MSITQENLALQDKYPDIEISFEEVFYAIEKIKHKKDYALKMQRLENKFNNFSPSEYYNLAVERMTNIVKAKTKDENAEYVVEKGKNFEILAFLAYYFANDQKGLIEHSLKNDIFLKIPASNVSVDKSVIILAGTGRGKTILMKAFCQNPYKSFAFIDATTITNDYKTRESFQKSSGVDSTAHFSGDFKHLGKSYYAQNEYDLGIDDFGTEKPILQFNEPSIEPVLDVIMQRLNHNKKTLITSNLTLEKIEERYGSRLVSRLKEEANILFFPIETPDYRELKQIMSLESKF